MRISKLIIGVAVLVALGHSAFGEENRKAKCILSNLTDSPPRRIAIPLRQLEIDHPPEPLINLSNVARLKSINGIPIFRLENKMRPGADSKIGFLGNDDSLLNVLKNDNQIVTSLGLTHRQMAEPLATAALACKKAGRPDADFIFNGQSFHVHAVRWMGFQRSPFEDGTMTASDFIVTNKKTGEEIRYSGLVPDMIARYGFYEGPGTAYRLEPKTIAKLFNLSAKDGSESALQSVVAKKSISALDQMSREQSHSNPFNLESKNREALEKAIALNHEASDKKNLAAIFSQLKRSEGGYEIQFKVKGHEDTPVRAVVTGFLSNRGGTFNPAAARYDSSYPVYSRPIFAINGKVSHLSSERIIPESIQITPTRVPDEILSTQSRSQAAQRAGVVGLRHDLSKIDTLISILKDGRLNGADNFKEYNTKGNYLMLENKWDYSGNRNAISIHFKNDILDRNDFYANRDWSYGHYRDSSIRFDEEIPLRTLFYKYGCGHFNDSGSHEVIFVNPIGLESVDRIELPEKDRSKVLETIKNKGILPPKGRTWESLIVPKSERYELPTWLSGF